MNDNKKFQKKVLKLISAIRKCSTDDLMLFVALVLVRFNNIDNGFDGEDTLFQKSIALFNELNSDNNVHYLLNK